jgi:MFS family permease
MGFNHAVFSFAFAGAALFSGLMRQAGFAPVSYLPMLALLAAGLAVATISGGQREEGAAETDEAPNSALPWGAVMLTGVILLAAFIGENATEAWSALHIERTLGAPPGEGGFGPAMLGLVMGIARLCGQVVAERLGHARLIFGSACLGIVGTLTIAAAQSPAMVLVGVAINALGMAVIVPSAMSMLGARVQEATRALALSRAWMLGITGFFVGPALMGGVSQLFGLRVSFALVACIVALILPAVWRLARSG